MRKLIGIFVAVMCVAIAGGEAVAAPAPKTVTKQKKKPVKSKKKKKEVSAYPAVTELIIRQEVRDADEELDCSEQNYYNLGVQEGISDITKEVVEKKEIVVAPPSSDGYDGPINMAMVEKKPEFPGGETAMYAWLSSNIRYPREAAEANVQGRVVVSFIVEKDGSISNAHVVRSVHPALGDEGVRVVASMPKWSPGRNNGKPVRVTYMLPISFKFSDPTPPTPQE